MKLLNSEKLYEHEIPYLIALTGSYVYEIVEDIYESLDMLLEAGLMSFVSQNKNYIYKTECRIESYWKAYHYRKFYRDNYIGFEIKKLLMEFRNHLE